MIEAVNITGTKNIIEGALPNFHWWQLSSLVLLLHVLLFLSFHTLDLQVATVLWVRLLVGQGHISGWCTVTTACVRCGATRLVYTSTYNVVFGGQEIRNGDQSLPYLPLDKVVLFTQADHRTGFKCIVNACIVSRNEE